MKMRSSYPHCRPHLSRRNNTNKHSDRTTRAVCVMLRILALPTDVPDECMTNVCAIADYKREKEGGEQRERERERERVKIDRIFKAL